MRETSVEGLNDSSVAQDFIIGGPERRGVNPGHIKSLHQLLQFALSEDAPWVNNLLLTDTTDALPNSGLLAPLEAKLPIYSDAWVVGVPSSGDLLEARSHRDIELIDAAIDVVAVPKRTKLGERGNRPIFLLNIHAFGFPLVPRWVGELFPSDISGLDIVRVARASTKSQIQRAMDFSSEVPASVIEPEDVMPEELLFSIGSGVSTVGVKNGEVVNPRIIVGRQDALMRGLHVAISEALANYNPNDDDNNDDNRLDESAA